MLWLDYKENTLFCCLIYQYLDITQSDKYEYKVTIGFALKLLTHFNVFINSSFDRTVQ